ncbi:MAG: VWA domain-containing protein [Planctomycetaceae bacterium]|nr:VWA domain-containing protein [Planctomycetaceae bacterium]
MTLLNSTAMFAAAAVIVPILIHLQKRRKSKVVDWPAMQFLKRTVTSRRRGLILENLLLLLLRCLVILLFVLAMARPAVESDRVLSWVLFSLLAGSGLLLLTAALVSTWTRRNRWMGVVGALLLFGCASATLSTSPASLVEASVDRDVAIVIDSSLTMSLGDDQTSHFDTAISHAQSLVKMLSGNSTVSIVMAGPIAETVDGSPFRNLRRSEQILGTLSLVAGGSDLESAIQTATSLLKRAPNTRKQILLLTDNQLCNWESIDELRLAGRSFATNPATEESGPEFVTGTEVEATDSIAEVACAAIVASLPEKTENISVNRVEVSASLVTPNRPIPIQVEVRNGGSTTVQDVAVHLLVDGREAASESLIQIEPGVSSTVRFLHAFQQAGQHVVSGTVEIADQLADDNRFDSVIDVIPNLSILLVDGSTDVDPAQQSATFARLALDPASLREPKVAGNKDDLFDGNSGRAILTSTIEAASLDEIESLENYQLIMLCDVPRLPANAADRLASFVEVGGGLWVIPGEESDTSFYNNWSVPLTDKPIMPAQLGERIRWVGKADGETSQLGVALEVAGRPFISDMFERGDHDLSDISVSQFWSTTRSEQAIVGMQLTNGEALYTERAVGRGRVLMQNVSLARRDSNFPANLAFPVLMHLWTYHLAASNGMDFNFEPTSELVTELASRINSTEQTEILQLIEPGGTTRDIPVSWESDSPVARIGQVTIPGVYQLRDKHSAASVSSFAIQRDREESDLSITSAERLQEIGRGLGIELIDDVSQLTAPVATESIGTEIWDTLLFAVLWLLAAECLVTKWIRSRRRVTPVESSASNGSAEHKSAAPQLTSFMESPDCRENAPIEDSAAVFGVAP